MESKDKDIRPDWKLLVLRLMAGGYLVYLAYHLMAERDLPSSIVYLLGPAVFFLAGMILVCWATRRLVKGEYKR